MSAGFVQLAYLVATGLFVFALHWMNTPATARRGGLRRRRRHGCSRSSPPGRSPRSCTTSGSWSRSSPGSRSASRSRGCRSPPCRSGPRSRTPSAASPPAWWARPSTTSGSARAPEQLTAFRMTAHHRRGPPGLPHLHRQPHGRREAAGGEVDSPAAGDLSVAERHQHRPAAARGRARRRRGAPADRGVGAGGVRGDHRARAALRRAADHPDRRRRHADGDRDPQLLRRPLRRGDGLRAGQQAADHRGRAGRLQRPDPRDHHVQGDEPLVHQRAVRRLRPGAAGQGGRRGAGLQGGDHRGRGARCWSRPTWW